jgi:Protein of unknown function (DUF3237)
MTQYSALSRRSALGVGAAVLMLSDAKEVLGNSPASSVLGNRPPDFAPAFEWEFDMLIQWDGGRHPTGTYSSGQRIYNVVARGEFAGPRLKGTVLPGGGDWALLNPPQAPLQGTSDLDRHFQFDARYIMRTEDGTHIYVSNRGGKTSPAAATSVPGKAISTPLFDVPIGSRFEFLAHNVYIALSEARPTETLLSLFRVKTA